MLLVLALTRKIFQFVTYLTRIVLGDKKFQIFYENLKFFSPSSGKEISGDNLGSFYW